MPSNDEFYPAEFDGVIYDCYGLRVVFDREKTGFEETKDFPIVINSIVILYLKTVLDCWSILSS